MNMRAIGLTLAVLLIAIPCLSADEVKYTRVGAEAGPNATGDIPAFDSSRTFACPAGYQKGDYLPSPFKDEKPLFRIDHTNIDKYADKLAPGQIARLKKSEFYYMNVYPSHRIFNHPEKYCQATEKNVETCKLDEKGVLRGFNGGIAFPHPKNGLEAIWNVKKPWAGDDLIADDCRRVVSPNGKIRKMRWTVKIMAFDETRLSGAVPNPDGATLKILNLYTYPADREGESAFQIAYIDDNLKQDIWSYIPTLNRVRRAPTLQGGTQLDGEWSADEVGFDFRDTASNWNWKLVGKKEMYIPANNYEIWLVDAPDEQECKAGDLNPERIRYELRRVWVVEGTPKEGFSHPYSKRVGYYDEDIWSPVVADRYDKRGNLWRMAEYFQCYNYCTKQRYVIGYIYLNLESGRYDVFGGCRTKDTKTNATDLGLDAKEFTVETLRRYGR